MAKARKDVLEERIAEAAQIFATEVVSLIGRMTLEDLGQLGDGSHALKKPLGGRASQAAGTAPNIAMKRRRSWPICGLSGCGKAYYPASGKSRLCYEHFLGSGGRHPSKRD